MLHKKSTAIFIVCVWWCISLLYKKSTVWNCELPEKLDPLIWPLPVVATCTLPYNPLLALQSVVWQLYLYVGARNWPGMNAVTTRFQGITSWFLASFSYKPSEVQEESGKWETAQVRTVQMLLYRLPDSSRVNILCLGWMSSFSILWAHCRLLSFNHPLQRLPVLGRARGMPLCDVFSQGAFYCFSGKADENMAAEFSRRLISVFLSMENWVEGSIYGILCGCVVMAGM